MDAPAELKWRAELQATYRSGSTSLSDAFFKPCLREAVRYRRAAGYFSSTALLAWAEALQQSAPGALSVELLISPELSAIDRLAIERSTSLTDRQAILQRGGDALVAAVLSAPAERQHQADYLVWLLASGSLQLQFALPSEATDGIFHRKIGVFEFGDGARVAFEGSANETAGGHRRNYEGLQVFRSWVLADEARLELVHDDLKRLWLGQEEGVIVVPVSSSTLGLVRERAEDNERKRAQPPVREDNRWEHQRRAVSAFLAQPHGVLQMATGTGKTRTALQIATTLTQQRAIDTVIVSTEGNDLLDQWCAELLAWRAAGGHTFALQKHFGTRHDGMSFALKPVDSVLVASREQVGKFMAVLTAEQAARTLVIHDEVHGLGAPQARLDLGGKHARFGYVLGLSATPEREYDPEGTTFIESEIGPVVFEFGLEDAIRKGILVEFDYVPLPYELTDGDRARLRQVYSRQAARKAEGRPMRQEEVWTELSKVYKTAENKPATFAAYLNDHPECLQACILFLEERAYGDRLLPMLHDAGVRYRNYYADDDKSYLLAFGRGEIDCVVTCHKISQGIDIQRLRSVVLFSSARARLETVQRIGRCLRRDPNDPFKRALVIDFVRIEHDDEDGDTADRTRSDWLQGLSAIKREETPDANR